jgi:hypothetical protein
MMAPAMSSLLFKRLNDGWNAEPNVPAPKVEVSGSQVQLKFLLNSFVYHAEAEEVGCLTFCECSMWRLGSTNDEGWYAGQCRYSKIAPAWGEFYELLGHDSQRTSPTDWHVPTPSGSGNRHFLFYLRDETFECISGEWSFERGSAGA